MAGWYPHMSLCCLSIHPFLSPSLCPAMPPPPQLARLFGDFSSVSFLLCCVIHFSDTCSCFICLFVSLFLFFIFPAPSPVSRHVFAYQHLPPCQHAPTLTWSGLVRARCNGWRGIVCEEKKRMELSACPDCLSSFLICEGVCVSTRVSVHFNL